MSGRMARLLMGVPCGRSHDLPDPLSRYANPHGSPTSIGVGAG